jgi:hypothetical protein
MSAPLVPQPICAEVRAIHARLRALDVRAERQNALRHAERLRRLSERQAARLKAQAEARA